MRCTGVINSISILLCLMLPAASRRSKIRPPRKSLALESAEPAVDYEASWAVLAHALVQIQNKNVSNLLYEQLYRKAYTLVLRKCGARLYDDVVKLIGQHLRQRRDVVLEIFQEFNLSQNEDFLRATVREWTEHLQLMKFISDVLMYLNRVHVKENKKLLIYDLGIVLFDVNFVRLDNLEVGTRLIQIVIDEITKSRNGCVITTRLNISQVISMFEMLLEEQPAAANLVLVVPGESLYAYFEQSFLIQLEVFFSNLSEEYLAPLHGSKYLHDVLKFVQDEENRLGFFVPPTTYPKLISLMNNILIKDKIDRVMSLPVELQGLHYWLEPLVLDVVRDHTAELRILYDLMGRIDSDRKLLHIRLKEAVVAHGLQLADKVASHFEQQAATNGPKKAQNNSSAYATKWIDTVLQYQKQSLKIVEEAFGGDAAVKHTIYAGVRLFVNAASPTGLKRSSAAPSTNAPELLSSYMDLHIKQFTKAVGAKRLADGSDETAFLNNSIAFLKIVKDKDAFEAHYAAHFAKRFLNSKGSGAVGELEELAIAKLGEELGGLTMEKIGKMKKDVALSAELTMEWKAHVAREQLPLVELELKICNVSDWPKAMTRDYKSFSNTDSGVGFIWPAHLRETIKTFEEYWLTGNRNDNKSLYWCPKFGLMDLRITYPTKTYDINLSTYAGIIMLLFAPLSYNADGSKVLAFAEKRELTYSEISELTQIPEADLKRQLQSIAVAPRLRLLVKLPMSKDVNNSDIFRLNEKFKSPTTKVKVLTVSSSSRPEKKSDKQDEADEVQANIEEGRKHLVNAAIVRIMKARQTINHNELIGELVKQLQNRFPPLTLLIKQRIEDLIEKEYLNRDDDAPNVYHYIA